MICAIIEFNGIIIIWRIQISIARNRIRQLSIQNQVRLGQFH